MEINFGASIDEFIQKVYNLASAHPVITIILSTILAWLAMKYLFRTHIREDVYDETR